MIAGTLGAFVGCSSGTPAAPPFSPTTTEMNYRADARKVTETLTASRVVVKVQSCASGAGNATFTAKGKAKGRVRGKFALKGSWNFYDVSGAMFWTFAETFTIKGTHPMDGTITGSGSNALAKCKSFGPAGNTTDLTYHLGTASGAATTNLIKNGAMLLEQLH